MLRSCAASYSSLLLRRPLSTKALTAGLIAGIGDCLCQHFFPSSSPPAAFQPQRTASLALWALCTAPLVSRWYGFLSLRPALQRVAADQLLWAPASISLMLFWLGLAETGSAEQGLSRVRECAGSTLRANWAVWPALQCINFLWVPLPLQVLYGNVLGLGWGVVLSSLSHPEQQAPGGQALAPAGLAPEAGKAQLR
jgi:protein Mpv17